MTKNARGAADVERLADLEAALARRTSQVEQLQRLRLARTRLSEFEDYVTDRRRKLTRELAAAEAAAKDSGALQLLEPAEPKT